MVETERAQELRTLRLAGLVALLLAVALIAYALSVLDRPKSAPTVAQPIPEEASSFSAPSPEPQQPREEIPPEPAQRASTPNVPSPQTAEPDASGALVADAAAPPAVEEAAALSPDAASRVSPPPAPGPSSWEVGLVRVELTGGLSKQAVIRALERATEPATGCVKKILAESAPRRDGAFDLRARIDLGGYLRDLSVDGPAGLAPSCLLEVYEGLRMVRPDTGEPHVTFSLEYRRKSTTE